MGSRHDNNCRLFFNSIFLDNLNKWDFKACQRFPSFTHFYLLIVGGNALNVLFEHGVRIGRLRCKLRPHSSPLKFILELQVDAFGFPIWLISDILPPLLPLWLRTNEGFHALFVEGVVFGKLVDAEFVTTCLFIIDGEVKPLSDPKCVGVFPHEQPVLSVAFLGSRAQVSTLESAVELQVVFAPFVVDLFVEGVDWIRE